MASLAVRGSRLSASQILECLASGMSPADIDEAFDHAFPWDALAEVLKVASELTDSFGESASRAMKSYPEFALCVD